MAEPLTWSLVMAYYNEEDYLEETIKSLLNQDKEGIQLILVDNGSKDRSREVAMAATANSGAVKVVHLVERKPGQMNALKAGLAIANTEFVSLIDADTWYPPHYVRTCEAAFRSAGPGVVGVMATDIYAPPLSSAGLGKRVKNWVVSRILTGQAHTGMYGLSFRAAALAAAGGVDPKYWPYIMSDHELVHRVLRQGESVYPFGLWCMPSQRRAPSADVRWTLFERLLYHFTPYSLKDWFFYEFLAPRFESRKVGFLAHRDQPWQNNA